MKRILTAFVLIPVVLYAVLLAPWWGFFLVLATVAGICFHEFSSITGGLPVIGYVTGLALLLTPASQMGLTFTLIALLALALSLPGDNLAAALPRAAMFVLGQAYIFGAWRTAAMLRDISPYWLVFGLAVNWIGDSGAFYVGRKIGRHKLAPQTSPGKSWEGAIASVAVSAIFGALFLTRLLPPVSLAQAIGLSIAANIAGQVGDLAESAIKRGVGVKDSGNLLPGHGGLLDRVDSSLFSLPVLYGMLALMRSGS